MTHPLVGINKMLELSKKYYLPNNEINNMINNLLSMIYHEWMIKSKNFQYKSCVEFSHSQYSRILRMTCNQIHEILFLWLTMYNDLVVCIVLKVHFKNYSISMFIFQARTCLAFLDIFIFIHYVYKIETNTLKIHKI